MHWYVKYINEYKQHCLECGWKSSECDGDCEWCDEFQQDFADCVGVNERVRPYDYCTQEEYEVACTFANDADDIVSDEEVHWWNGDFGYVHGISSPAVDPRDFTSREEYEDALHRHLFEKAVSRYAVIPSTNFWMHAYVKFLKDSESVFCADKSILALLEELNYCDDGNYEDQAVPLIDDLEHEIRYSSWKKPRFELQRSRPYSNWLYRSFYSHKETVKRCRKKYTEEQFWLDLFYHYPELTLLVNGVMHRPVVNGSDKSSQLEKYMEEYLPDVLIASCYMHDMYGFSIEECIQNGLEGLLKGLKNRLWDQNTPRWMWNLDKEVRKEQYVLWEMRLHMIGYSQELADQLGFTVNRKVAKIIEAVMFERKNLKDLSADDFFESYEDWEVSKFCIEKIRKFFEGKNTIGRIPPQDSSEEYLDCDAEICRMCAIDLLRNLVQQLPNRERNCLVLRYGFESGTPMTLEEIGEKQWITKERVRQIERRGIELLKKLPGYADLCELTNHSIPPEARYFNRGSGESNQPVQSGYEMSATASIVPSGKTIEECGLPVRLRIAMHRVGINYLNDLMAMTLEELREFPNLTKAIWRMTESRLNDLGIKPSEAIAELACSNKYT